MVFAYQHGKPRTIPVILGNVMPRVSVDRLNILKGIMDTMRDLHPGCEFVRSDARNSEFPDGSFDLAVDKGLFDSITASTEGREEAAK